MERRTVVVGDKIFRIIVNDCVYEPSDDTELAISLIDRLPEYLGNKNNIEAVDLGTGTGILALAIRDSIRPRRLVATDISPFAVRIARINLNYPEVLVVRCFIGRCLREGWDVVVANPPYLPTWDHVRGKCGLYESMTWGWPGAVPSFCREAARLSRHAVVFVSSSLSGFDVVKCLGEHGFDVVDSVSRSFFMETIYAYLAVKR